MTIRVLIVEDHNLVREALRSLVGGMQGFEVADAVSDGKQAIRAAAALQSELVLMDLSMPGMSGLDATVEIRRRLPGVHVVLLTLSRNEEFVREAFQIGADGYLLKGRRSKNLNWRSIASVTERNTSAANCPPRWRLEPMSVFTRLQCRFGKS